MPTTTEFGYCPHCDIEHVELVPLGDSGVLGCHKCEALDVWESKEAFEQREIQ